MQPASLYGWVVHGFPAAVARNCIKSMIEPQLVVGTLSLNWLVIPSIWLVMGQKFRSMRPQILAVFSIHHPWKWEPKFDPYSKGDLPIPPGRMMDSDPQWLSHTYIYIYIIHTYTYIYIYIPLCLPRGVKPPTSSWLWPFWTDTVMRHKDPRHRIDKNIPKSCKNQGFNWFHRVTSVKCGNQGHRFGLLNGPVSRPFENHWNVTDLSAALVQRHMLRRAREKGYRTAIASCYPSLGTRQRFPWVQPSDR